VIPVSQHWPPATTTKALVELLRNRDGGRCWLCGAPIDFKAEPNSARAPSLEHLIARSRGGPDTMDNLVLCHPPCNRELGDVPLAEKIKAREVWKEAAWKAALSKRLGKLLLG
jgi:5-methylcytosine-specific restriction endonuclease McrA